MLRHNRGEMRSEGVEFLGLMRRSNELALEGGMGGVNSFWVVMNYGLS